jgi:fructoselysine and glucoselysine-specific PTS system IIA component
VKTKILIATHGKFAEGIKDSLQMITGIYDDIEAICAYSQKDIDYRDLIESKVKEHDYSTSNLLVITDLVGGSVNNEFMKYIKDYPFYLVGGLNLGLLLELVMQKDDLNEKFIRSCCRNSEKFIVFCNDCLEDKYVESDF